MPTYKLLSLDHDGKTVASRMFKCEHEDDAMHLAERMTVAHTRVQVWADERLIGEALAPVGVAAGAAGP